MNVDDLKTKLAEANAAYTAACEKVDSAKKMHDDAVEKFFFMRQDIEAAKKNKNVACEKLVAADTADEKESAVQAVIAATEAEMTAKKAHEDAGNEIEAANEAKSNAEAEMRSAKITVGYVEEDLQVAMDALRAKVVYEHVGKSSSRWMYGY